MWCGNGDMRALNRHSLHHVIQYETVPRGRKNLLALDLVQTSSFAPIHESGQRVGYDDTNLLELRQQGLVSSSKSSMLLGVLAATFLHEFFHDGGLLLHLVLAVSMSNVGLEDVHALVTVQILGRHNLSGIRPHNALEIRQESHTMRAGIGAVNHLKDLNLPHIVVDVLGVPFKLRYLTIVHRTQPREHPLILSPRLGPLHHVAPRIWRGIGQRLWAAQRRTLLHGLFVAVVAETVACAVTMLSTLGLHLEVALSSTSSTWSPTLDPARWSNSRGAPCPIVRSRIVSSSKTSRSRMRTLRRASSGSRIRAGWSSLHSSPIAPGRRSLHAQTTSGRNRRWHSHRWYRTIGAVRRPLWSIALKLHRVVVLCNSRSLKLLQKPHSVIGRDMPLDKGRVRCRCT